MPKIYRRRPRRTNYRKSARKVRRTYRRTRKVYRRAARPEVKRIEQDANAVFNSVSTGGQVATFSQGIVQGTDNNQRIGRKVVLHAIKVMGTLVGGQTNGAADDSYNMFRMTCYTVKQGIGGLAFGVNDLLDAYHLNGLGRVYYDRKFILRSPGKDSLGYIPAVKQISVYVKLDKPITYTAAGNVAENDIFFQMVSDSLAIPNPGFVNGKIVKYFYDA